MIAALTPSQQRALDTLAPIVDPSTYLAGGVAIALRLQHRQSRDLDLFTTADPTSRVDAFADPALGARIVSRAEGTLHLEISGVPASWLRYRYPLLAAAEHIVGVPIPVVSLDDAMCMKLSAIAGRGAARDFWDLHEILSRRSVPLSLALAAFERKFVTDDTGHVIKSLSYFADADASPLPLGLPAERWEAIKRDFDDWVRRL